MSFDSFHLDLHADQRLRLAKEMYLKAILQLGGACDVPVKAVDLVTCLSVSKSTVSEMLHKLEDEGLVKYDSSTILFTAKGKERAQIILKKYQVVRKLLEKIGVPSDKVHEDACNLEHAISDEATAKLEEYLKTNP